MISLIFTVRDYIIVIVIVNGQVITLSYKKVTAGAFNGLNCNTVHPNNLFIQCDTFNCDCTYYVTVSLSAIVHCAVHCMRDIACLDSRSIAARRVAAVAGSPRLVSTLSSDSKLEL